MKITILEGTPEEVSDALKSMSVEVTGTVDDKYPLWIARYEYKPEPVTAAELSEAVIKSVESKLTPAPVERMLKVGDRVHNSEFENGIVRADSDISEDGSPYLVDFGGSKFLCSAKNHNRIFVTRIPAPEFTAGQEVILRGKITEIDEDDGVWPYKVEFSKSAHSSQWFKPDELRACLVK